MNEHLQELKAGDRPKRKWEIELEYKDKEIERLKIELQDTKEHLGEYLHEQEDIINKIFGTYKEEKVMEKYYEKYEKAIKLFEKLGYTYSWDDGYIEYRKEKGNGLEPTYISFDTMQADVFMTRFKDDGVNCSKELLLAINQQCKLLWKSFNEVEL